MKTRRFLADELTELQHDPDLVGLNAEGKCLPCDNRASDNSDQKQQRARNAAATHHLLDLVLAPLEHLFQIRRLPTAGRSLAPWSTPIATAFRTTAATTLIVPRHVLDPSIR
jgi:hypothetical protein